MSCDLAERILGFLDGSYRIDSTDEFTNLHEMLRFTEDLPTALLDEGLDAEPLLKLQRRAKRRIDEVAHAYRERFEILAPDPDLIRAWDAAYVYLEDVYSELPPAPNSAAGSTS